MWAETLVLQSSAMLQVIAIFTVASPRVEYDDVSIMATEYVKMTSHG